MTHLLTLFYSLANQTWERQQDLGFNKLVSRSYSRDHNPADSSNKSFNTFYTRLIKQHLSNPTEFLSAEHLGLPRLSPFTAFIQMQDGLYCWWRHRCATSRTN